MINVYDHRIALGDRDAPIPVLLDATAVDLLSRGGRRCIRSAVDDQRPLLITIVMDKLARGHVMKDEMRISANDLDSFSAQDMRSPVRGPAAAFRTAPAR